MTDPTTYVVAKSGPHHVVTGRTPHHVDDCTPDCPMHPAGALNDFSCEESPSDRTALIAWLRALPERTVLLDKKQQAWQVGRAARGRTILMLVGFGSYYLCSMDDDMSEVARSGPFRVLWMLPLHRKGWRARVAGCTTVELVAGPAPEPPPHATTQKVAGVDTLTWFEPEEEA